MRGTGRGRWEEARPHLEAAQKLPEGTGPAQEATYLLHLVDLAQDASSRSCETAFEGLLQVTDSHLAKIILRQPCRDDHPVKIML